MNDLVILSYFYFKIKYKHIMIYVKKYFFDVMTNLNLNIYKKLF